MCPQSTDERAQRIESLEREMASLQSGVRLTRLRDLVEDLGSTATRLKEWVRELRGRGYVFEKALAGDAADLERRWNALRIKVVRQTDKEAASLEKELSELERRIRRLSTKSGRRSGSQSRLERAEADVDAFQEKVSAAERSIEGMYDTFKAEVDELTAHLRRVEWMLDQLAEAKFQLLPTEAGIMAVKARWDQGGKDDPEGLLYLTDQRLIFEQKQEVATKKVLFVVTDKEMVQQLLLEVPVGALEDAQASKKGLMGHEDHLDITFAPGPPVSSAHFHLDGQDCNMWQRLIGRAKAGDFDQDRAVAIDREVEERVRAAPSKCPSCGAPVTQEVLRGMDSLTCQYCDHVMRL
jgi:DNA repair exonuclease SbcCD ATPase subunit